MVKQTERDNRLRGMGEPDPSNGTIPLDHVPEGIGISRGNSASAFNDFSEEEQFGEKNGRNVLLAASLDRIIRYAVFETNGKI